MSPVFPSKTPPGRLARKSLVFDPFSKREGREEDQTDSKGLSLGLFALLAEQLKGK